MNNKTLILLIVVIAAITIGVVSWRTPSSNDEGTPTVTATPSVTDPFAATPTVTITITTTVTATPTPTVTATATPTPTPTVAGTFEDIRDTDWFYGVTEQTVSGKVYFIDATNKKVIKKGTSVSDSGAQTVFTTDIDGEVGSFAVNGSYLYVATKRDAATSYSKMQRMVLSSGSKATLYNFYSSKYEIAQFAIKKDNDAKSGFYIGLKGVDDKAAPSGMYVKSYAQQWIKTFVGVDKTASILGLAPREDGTQLAGLFLVDTTQTQAYIDL